jgi:hypothetical protein
MSFSASLVFLSPPCTRVEGVEECEAMSPLDASLTHLKGLASDCHRTGQDRTGQDSLFFSLHSSLRWTSTPETIGSDKQLAPVTRADEKGSLLLL